MDKKILIRKLQTLGYPLFEEEGMDADIILADVVRSKDLRLWEGFPLLLANAAEKYAIDYEKIKRHLKKSPDKSSLNSLILMSLVLYETLNIKFPWTGKFFNLPAFKKESFGKFVEKFKKGESFKVDDKFLSPERITNTFKNYFKREENRLTEFAARKDVFDLEYAMSQIFSPKQKELFLKKLRGEKMTKTEREYYSRTVRKKIIALANAELHKLAQKVI